MAAAVVLRNSISHPGPPVRPGEQRGIYYFPMREQRFEVYLERNNSYRASSGYCKTYYSNCQKQLEYDAVLSTECYNN